MFKNEAVIKVLVFLGQFLLQVFAESAPGQKNGICDVKDGKLLCRNVTHLPKQLPMDIDCIHVVDSNLDRLEQEDFKSTSVETLKFERNVIGELREGAFRLLPNLKSLHMSDNLVRANLTWCLFFGLDNLTSLDLEDNQFNTGPFSKKLKFKNRAAPVQYSKEFCRCPTTADECFSAPCEELTVLPKLQFLKLSCNPFITLTSDTFLPLRQSPIVSLSLRACQLLDIDEGEMSVSVLARYITVPEHFFFFPQSTIQLFIPRHVGSSTASPKSVSEVLQGLEDRSSGREIRQYEPKDQGIFGSVPELAAGGADSRAGTIELNANRTYPQRQQLAHR